MTSTFNEAYKHRLGAAAALPLSGWDPDNPACAKARAHPRRPGPSSGGGPASHSKLDSGSGGGGGGSLIPALGGGPAGAVPQGRRPGIPALGGAAATGGMAGGMMAGRRAGQGAAAMGPRPMLASNIVAGGGGAGSGGGLGGNVASAPAAQVMSAVAQVLRSKVAMVPSAFGELAWWFSGPWSTSPAGLVPCTAACPPPSCCPAPTHNRPAAPANMPHPCRRCRQPLDVCAHGGWLPAAPAAR
jgi:hypothetical protein